MKKHKLKARLNGHIDYLRNLALERLDANTALRRELEALRTGCNGAIERNVQLVAEFNALERAHEALHAQNVELAAQRDAALARARKSDELFSRIQALCGSEDV